MVVKNFYSDYTVNRMTKWKDINMIKAVLFDLDGTLLPMDYELFVKKYFKALAVKIAPLGFDPRTLADNIWAGTAAMVKNDGSVTNEEAFWVKFSEFYGPEVRTHEPAFDAFYRNEFDCAKEVCGYEPLAKAIVEELKSNGKIVALATNPFFPAVATEKRIRWAGLEPEDFAIYTTYENSYSCKPNPAYYLEVAKKIGCKPEECAMVGNDVEEDLIAETVGMKVFLLTDCILNKKGKDISKYPQGGFEELRKWLREL